MERLIGRLKFDEIDEKGNISFKDLLSELLQDMDVKTVPCKTTGKASNVIHPMTALSWQLVDAIEEGVLTSNANERLWIQFKLDDPNDKTDGPNFMDTTKPILRNCYCLYDFMRWIVDESIETFYINGKLFDITDALHYYNHFLEVDEKINEILEGRAKSEDPRVRNTNNAIKAIMANAPYLFMYVSCYPHSRDEEYIPGIKDPSTISVRCGYGSTWKDYTIRKDSADNTVEDLSNIMSEMDKYDFVAIDDIGVYTTDPKIRTSSPADTCLPLHKNLDLPYRETHFIVLTSDVEINKNIQYGNIVCGYLKKEPNGDIKAFTKDGLTIDEIEDLINNRNLEEVVYKDKQLIIYKDKDVEIDIDKFKYTVNGVERNIDHWSVNLD